MLIVPLRQIPNQTLQCQLNGQPCTIDVFQYRYGLFMNLYVNGDLVIGSVLCENLVLIVRDTYLGFSGDFCFFDTQGIDNPVYTGVGSRYVLVYLSPDDLSSLGIAT